MKSKAINPIIYSPIGLFLPQESLSFQTIAKSSAQFLLIFHFPLPFFSIKVEILPSTILSLFLRRNR